jgi:cytochrome oxidase Cu insertion factor (SCO1/SenC/PrrC family)
MRNRVFLLFLIALFIVPLLLAWSLVGYWQPGSTVNHGELLTPAQPIPHLQMQQADGRLLNKAYLQGHWTLTYVDSVCEKPCRQALYKIRQVRLALGKDMYRAQILFMMTKKPDSRLLNWLSQEHIVLTAGMADARTLHFFTQAFPDGIAAVGEWIYLIDPLGNLLMRYDVETNPKGILEDLERLLKYSKIG